MGQLTPTKPSVMVIGAGFAGIETVRALAYAEVDVTLVDKKNHHCFQPLRIRARILTCFENAERTNDETAKRKLMTFCHRRRRTDGRRAGRVHRGYRTKRPGT
jgi:cation diffusion facilitator CzcD-associated flavoprotein CzcO